MIGTLLPEDESPGREIREFYERVQAYYLRGPSVEAALGVIEQGMRFLEVARFGMRLRWVKWSMTRMFQFGLLHFNNIKIS